MTEGAPSTGQVAPPSPPSDTRDWSLIAHEPCDQCGFDPSAALLNELPLWLANAGPVWAEVLSRLQASVRSDPNVWSASEYACHVRDTCTIFARRALEIRHEQIPTFDNFDQEQTAVDQRYWAQPSSQVIDELHGALATAANAFDGVADDEWARVGRRSNGSLISLTDVAVLLEHEIRHHTRDVGGQI